MQSWGCYFKNVTGYILLCQKVTRYILLVTFQSNILHNLVISYLYTVPMNVLAKCLFH